MQKKDHQTSPEPDEIILLRDLAPRTDVTGGAARLIFGAHAQTGEATAAPVPIPQRPTRRKKKLNYKTDTTKPQK